ncbi:hypothetical protein ACFSUS_12700 [Spirosoma soli]|uniref:Uncharacterized protein n=1 Tax=Spirosoma soli TaxID=1770529 RepID=A0ABW5M3A2_9BACT
METIYEWLLHNTGNEGSHVTILNVKRTTEPGTEELTHLDIRGRTKDFTIVNVAVYPVETANSPDTEPSGLKDEMLKESYFFRNDQQVIDFLCEGRVDQAQTDGPGVRLVVIEPANDASRITFPPDQAS